MTRDELLAACFGRSDLKPGQKMFRMEEGEAVISIVDLSYKRVVIGQTTVTVATITNVCTDPDRRGKGYASALLRSAHNEVRAHPMVVWVAALAEDARFFARNGYRHVDPDGHPELLVFYVGGEPWPAGAIDLQGGW